MAVWPFSICKTFHLLFILFLQIYPQLRGLDSNIEAVKAQLQPPTAAPPAAASQPATGTEDKAKAGKGGKDKGGKV